MSDVSDNRAAELVRMLRRARVENLEADSGYEGDELSNGGWFNMTLALEDGTSVPAGGWWTTWDSAEANWPNGSRVDWSSDPIVDNIAMVPYQAGEIDAAVMFLDEDVVGYGETEIWSAYNKVALDLIRAHKDEIAAEVMALFSAQDVPVTSDEV